MEKPNLLTKDFPMLGETLAGRYELLDVIGEGGMGLIVRARQLSMDRDVAVKLVRPEALTDELARKRFEREVRIAKTLVHPNIVQLFDYGQVDGAAYVVMELLEGETLHDLIKREAPLSVGRAIDILEQVLNALTVAHSKGFVHRDLKPVNIFLTDAGRRRDFVKVLDFGIARPTEKSTDEFFTTTGFISGTLPYMAPEVIAKNRVSTSADVYAAGLILLEMLYRRYVFTGQSPTEMALQHMRLDIPIAEPLKGSAVERLVTAMTAKREEQRLQDADACLDLLQELRAALPVDIRLSREQVRETFAGFEKDVIDDLIAPTPSNPRDTDSPRTTPAGPGTDDSTLEPAADPVATDAEATGETKRQPLPSAAPSTSDLEDVTGKSLTPVVLLAIGLLVAFLVGLSFIVGDAPDAEPVVTAPAPPSPPPVGVPSVDEAVEVPQVDQVPEEALTATVFVDTRPSGAEVWIDGERQFTTPVEISVEERQDWTFKLSGYKDGSAAVGPDSRHLVVHLARRGEAGNAETTVVRSPEPPKPKQKAKAVRKQPNEPVQDDPEVRRVPMMVD